MEFGRVFSCRRAETSKQTEEERIVVALGGRDMSSEEALRSAVKTHCELRFRYTLTACDFVHETWRGTVLEPHTGTGANTVGFVGRLGPDR